jgi:hypothetical protein
MVSGFRDYRSPVGMANENCRSVLRCESSLGNCYVVLQRYRRILDDADVVAVALEDPSVHWESGRSSNVAQFLDEAALAGQ